MKTFTPKPTDLTHNWYVIDAQGAVIGRLAAQVATLLRGKHKATFAPHMDNGDHVIIINAAKITYTGNKDKKALYHHSGYPGGLRATTYEELKEEDPERLVKSAVKGMLPKNKLARIQLDRLHVFEGQDHTFQSQKPQVYEIVKLSQQSKK